MQSAPFHSDLSQGPAGGRAYWLTARDGVRIRIGLWNEGAPKGTVLLFPGRTEYIEKYGRAASDLATRGYCTLAIDWRGQGLADRLTADPMSGHVGKFLDYQDDIAAVLQAAEALSLPQPYYLLGHSMGGCIGLRALVDDLPVAAAAFSGPMWGIYISPAMRPAAWALSWGGAHFGFGHVYAPGTKPVSYVASEPFDDNLLTTDPEMFAYMQEQVAAEPKFGLGGPSLNWLHEALCETRDLAAMPSPDYPCLTFVGSNERIVDVPRIHQRMARWPNGQLEVIETGEHEVLMDTPEIRKTVFDGLDAFFQKHRGDSDQNGQSHVQSA